MTAAGFVRNDDAEVRFSVNAVAACSGYFWDFGTVRLPDQRQVAEQVREDERLLRQIQAIAPAIDRFLGDEPNHPDDDLHREHRRVPADLRRLFQAVARSRARKLRDLPQMRAPRANAAKPPWRDQWMAGLVRVWRDVAGLPVENKKPLKGFIIAAMEPYNAATTDKQAKDFLAAHIKSGMPAVGPTLIERFRPDK
jgi:hypothetical protein